jgi:hypothetical protein
MSDLAGNEWNEGLDKVQMRRQKAERRRCIRSA